MCLYEEKMLLQKVLQVSNASKVADNVAFRQLKRKLLVRQVNKYVKYFKMLTIISKKILSPPEKKLALCSLCCWVRPYLKSDLMHICNHNFLIV